MAHTRGCIERVKQLIVKSPTKANIWPDERLSRGSPNVLFDYSTQGFTNIEEPKHIKIDFSGLTIEELHRAVAEVKEEITKREQDSSKMYVYTHECAKSVKYHRNKYKHWAKLVSSVDTSKTNGYAYAGRFLNIGSEELIPVDSIVIECCGTTIIAYKCTQEGKKEINSAEKKAQTSLIRELAKIING